MEEPKVDVVEEILEESALDESDDFESIFAPKARENPVYIDDLPDALDVSGATPVLLTDKNGHVVIEKWYQGRWLGTTLYKVTGVNVLTGDVYLHDEANQQGASANFITGPKHGWRFKLPIPGLNLTRREAPKVQPTKTSQVPQVPQVDEAGNPLPKRIGRPKGSKNRSREEMAADNALKAQVKKDKKEARLAKKRPAA